MGSGEDFSRDVRFTDTVTRGVSFAPAYFRDGHPFMSIAVAHSGFNADVTVAEIDLRFLSDFLGDAEVGKVAAAYVVDKRGQVLASSAKGPEVGKDVSALPQVAALIKPDGQPQASGTDTERPGGADGVQHRVRNSAGWCSTSSRPRWRWRRSAISCGGSRF